jgi:hypothetical protein
LTAKTPLGEKIRKRRAGKKRETPEFFRKATRDGAEGLNSDLRRIAKLREHMATFEEVLKENHRMIDICADLLNRSQPPIAGKIEVRWWTDNRRKATYPVVIQWGEDGHTRKIPWRDMILLQKRSGPFQPNAAATKRILYVLRWFLNAREQMFETFERFGHVATAARRRDNVMKFFKSEGIDEISKEITRNTYSRKAC